MEHPRSPKPFDRAVAKAVSLLQAEPASRWTVSMLAKAVGVSRPVLARRFVEVMGVSPQRYLRRLRMELAATLLVHSDASLAEVGARVGYDSEFAFSKAFRRYYRCPPGAFRRRERELVPRTLCLAA